MPITFLDEEEDIAPLATPAKRKITFLDEEEDITPLAPQTKRKITFLDEEDDIAPVTPQAAQPAVTQPSPYKYDPARFRPKGLAAPKAEQEIGTLEGIANAARNAFDSSRQALDIVGDVTPEEAKNIAKIEFDKQSRKVAPGYDEYQKAEGFDAVLAFAKNPIEVTSNIVAEGLAGSLPALGAGLAAGGVGAAIGAPTVIGAPIGFTAGQVAGTFAGSLATEYGSKILEEMQEGGVDLTKPESIQGFFENEEAVAKARDKAISRGIPVAAFDAISAGIGGKLGRVIGKQFLTKTGEAAAELGVQAGLGGGGEVAGALAAGEPIEGKAVFGEIIGEAGPGAAEIITGRMADRAARVKAEEDAKIKAAAQLSDNLEQNSAPLTAAVVKSTTATTIEQDKLAAQLEEQLDADEIEKQVSGQLAVTKEPTAAPPAIQSKEEFTAIYSQVAPEELDAAEAGFTNTLATAATEEARANAQNALEAIKEVKATVTPPAPPVEPTITPTVTPAVPAAQPPITDATQEIIQPEGVRQEPQDGTQVQPTEEAGISDSLLGAARGQEEGQVVPAAPAIPEAITRAIEERRPISAPFVLQYGVDLPRGWRYEDDFFVPPAEPATAAEVTAVTPEPAEVAAPEPIISEIPPTSELVGAEPTQPTIREVPEISPIVGAEPAAIVEQEPVAPAESAVEVAKRTDFTTAATREEAGEIGRNIASQDPSLPPPPPPQFEVLESISNSQSRKAYNPDVLTEEAINEARENGFIIGKKVGKFRFTESGRNQLREWSDQARDRSLALDALRDEIGDIAVSQWDTANAPESAAAIAARTAPAPVTTPPVTEAVTPAAEQPAVSIPASGKPFEFFSIRNKEKAPSLGTQFGQDVEPSGKYISQSTPDAAKNLDARFEKKTVRFENPLVVEFGGEYGTATNWKNVLSSQYGGKTGKELSQAIRDAGYDGIVTVEPAKGPNRPASTSEIVDISSLKPKKQIVAPTPAAPAEPAAEPAGISVGNRIKLGKSPQTYTIEEVIPQSATERELGEQYYSVKNERTGETQVVEARDLKQVKGKGARKIATTAIDTTPENILITPPSQQYTFNEVFDVAYDMFGGEIPEGFTIVNDSTDKDFEFKAAYIPESGEIIVNLAYLNKNDDIRDTITHELGHYIFGDPEFRAAFDQFISSLSPEARADLDAYVDTAYNKETGEIRLEEKMVRAFVDQFISEEQAPVWRSMLDAIKRFLNKLGFKFNISDRDAISVFTAALDRYKAGEAISREGGARKIIDDLTAMDAEYLAAVERGDMETAQRMVDEAAKPPTYTLIDASKTQSDKIRWTDGANSQIEFYKSQIAKLPSVEEATREYEALVKAWNDAGLGQSVEDTIKGIIELKLQPPPSSLDEYLQTRIYLERKNAEAEIKKSQETLSRAPKGKTETEFKTGQPTVVKAYHSTPFGRLTEFSDEMLGRFTGAPSATKAHFFAGSPSVSETYFADDAWLLNHKGFFSLSAEQKKQLIESAREELPNGLDSTPDEIADLAMSLFDIDTYDTSPYENVRHDVYIRLNNPLVYDFKGAGYRDVSYNDLLVQAAEGGHDGVIMANTTDPGPASTLGSFPEPTNIIAVLRGHSSQIKSADPVTYDDAGDVIPLSQRFRPTSPDIRRMAAEPRREQVAGMKIGRIITTPPGITQKTTDIIRSKFFDSTKVSPENTSQAWAYISQFMDETDNNNNKFAGYVNQVTEEELAPEFRKGIKESMGASLFSVELANYAGRLAVQGDTKMLAYMIRNGNKMPTGEFASGVSQSGRVLNAFKKRLSSDISGVAAYETELESNVERLAAVLFGTNTPSKEQIKIAQDALTQSETIELGDANQVAADIKEVEGRTKTNLIDKVDAKISQAIDKSGRIKELEGKATRPRNIDAQAESVIESLQRSLGELPPLPQRRESDIRAIVKQDLRQNPDMGRREPWNNMLVGRLMQAGVSEEQAQTIADLTWKQHEQKAINHELKEMRKAAEEGSLAVIIDRIKNTSLEKQQSPEWKQDVIKEYLRDAGLSSQAAETAAKLYDSVISERIAAAKQKAFEDTLAKAAPWNNYASRNGKLAKDALKKIKEAIRTGVLDPEKNTESIIAALSGWTGFTKEQYQRIVELDTILNDPNQDDITKREAMFELNKIITKAKMPVRFKDALGAYYIGNALMGIPTALVNIVSPISFSIRNLMVDIAKYTKDNPAKIPVAFETFLDSMRSWYNQTSYAFKNQIYLNDVVEYLNGQNVLRETFDKGKKQWAEGKYAEGFANMAVGMTQITGRVLSALDQGAISMLENQNITRYAMAALENAKKKVPKDKIVEFANMTLDLKRRVIIENIAAGMDADRAGVLADLAVKSELRAALSEYEADTQSVLDSAINDALQSVGRNKVITIEGIERQQKDVSDSGILSYWPIKMLETVSRGAGNEGSGMQIFSKMVYGFALVPARTFHTAAWFSPYGFLRLAIDKYKTNKGQESPYAMSLQTEAQYRQRLTESIAGSIAMLGLFALRSGSSDEDEDKKFKIVITGNGPNAVTDKQYYDSWIKKYKPYSINIVLGDTVIPINIGRGGEALFFPIMLAGALDDYEIKSKQNLTKKEPDDLNAATEMLGSAFFALAQRGPYAAFTEPLFDASKQGRVTENLVSQLGYFGKTFVPVLGASITRNISDIINDPVDRSSIEGAIYANTPIVGPWVGTKALNALGQPIRADDWGDKLYKLGVPVVFSFPKNTPENELNELILKQGGGPTLPTRANAQKRFGDVLTSKEFETYVREYGRVMSDKMFKNRTRLANMKSADYDDELEKYARGYSIDGIKIKGASDSAVLAVKRMRQ